MESKSPGLLSKDMDLSGSNSSTKGSFQATTGKPAAAASIITLGKPSLVEGKQKMSMPFIQLAAFGTSPRNVTRSWTLRDSDRFSNRFFSGPLPIRIKWNLLWEVLSRSAISSNRSKRFSGSILPIEHIHNLSPGRSYRVDNSSRTVSRFLNESTMALGTVKTAWSRFPRDERYAPAAVLEFATTTSQKWWTKKDSKFFWSAE